MKTAKRSLALLLALVMALSMMAVIAAADEVYQPTDTYVLNYNGTYSGPKWQYFSPYWPAFKYDGAGDYTQSIAFSLYNTRNGSVIVTYCTDLDTGLESNSNFRRLNLEDSTYAGAAAGVLRSIMLMGYPNTDVAALGAAAGVEGLTPGEAVAATQAAIWKTAHGSRVEFTDFCRTIDTEWTPTQTQYYDICNAEIESGYASAENEATIEAHIAAVYNYLISLPATAPSEVAVSNASFKSWSEEPVLTENEDGTYNVTVSATVDVIVKDGDSLTLTAILGSYSASAALANGSNTLTLTIPNVPADVAHGDVKLAIDGYQTVSDVFLFDAVGERGSSQSLIGKDGSQLPVHAEIVVETPRIINIHKTGNGVGLPGIQFDVFYIGSREAYLNGDLKLSENPTAPSDKATYTMITDANGNATLNLTKSGLGDGVYMIVERKHPAIVQPVAPFYVIMPMTSEDGTHLEYTININPKNEVRGGPEIVKDVIELDNDFSTENAYDNHTWIISAEIPVDIAQGKFYKITDTLDYRLDLVPDSIKVQVESNDGTEVPAVLVKDVDYKLTVTDVEAPAQNGETDAFAVELTPSGMLKVAKTVSDVDAYKIRVYFDAQINANAEMGVEIPNQAILEYTNSVGIGFEDESDIPVVVTGGAKLKKVDAYKQDTLLAGAEFVVYRVATAEEVAAGMGVEINGINGKAVPVEFFDNPNLTGGKVTSAVSGEDGLIYIYGLAYGDYYLVETKAPAGYNLLGDPVKITVSGTTHLDENAVKIENVSGTVMPETGGMGTGMFTGLGIALMSIACGGLLIRKKKED